MTRWTVMAIASIALADTGFAQQSPSFTSKIEAVRVDVLVTDNGEPILGLGPADFEILDNGVPQQVELRRDPAQRHPRARHE